MPPILLFLTGASGAGKTAIVEELARRSLPGHWTHHFDSIGVPSAEKMVADFGSGEKWQAAMTGKWIWRLCQNPEGARAIVLEGQMRPHIIQAAWPKISEMVCRIALVDCAADIRRDRLAGPRGQPELASAQMDAWAAYLRGQADALGLPVVDTSRITVAEAADAVVALLEQ